MDENSVNEAGCIHTSQGLEFEYVGVIIGPDMFFADGRVQTNFYKRSKNDSSIRGLKKLYKENPDAAMSKGDEIIRNTYRTLLTRGIKGCRVFCTDKALSNYLKERRHATDLHDILVSETCQNQKAYHYV